YFENVLDTSDEWIKTRTGILERRFSRNGATSDLITPAAKECIEKRGISPDDIDCILVATITPDYMFPCTAAVVQHKLGIKNAWGYDISAACSGFVFALQTAAKLVESGASKKLLLCGADKMSSILDFEDRNTAVLFGDGAGVALIEMSDDPELGILDAILRMDGIGGQFLHQKAGGSYMPASVESVQNKEHFIYQDGKSVFKAAVIGMADVSQEIMQKNGLQSDDVRWLVPHQANLRIISATADRMGLVPEKVMVNIDRYGNTTAATIPMCLSEWYSGGEIRKGDRLVLSSFGAGYTWGAVYIRWNMND
ncbi:MAG: 3-oxoacyl-[acyl-carrier-protein] synthase, partial [Bacteroidota bacterium]|nr:3-oxoacyl-[acyl-carrier-protein] synthase [Bacteroidota bacterium]